jgi:hypothetical protein
MDGISRMKSLTLTDGEQVAFAEAATIARFGDIVSAPIRPHYTARATARGRFGP